MNPLITYIITFTGEATGSSDDRPRVKRQVLENGEVKPIQATVELAMIIDYSIWEVTGFLGQTDLEHATQLTLYYTHLFALVCVSFACLLVYNSLAILKYPSSEP